jgi:hypothetical protein
MDERVYAHANQWLASKAIAMVLHLTTAKVLVVEDEMTVANRFNIVSHPWLRQVCTSAVRLIKISATAVFLTPSIKTNDFASDGAYIAFHHRTAFGSYR